MKSLVVAALAALALAGCATQQTAMSDADKAKASADAAAKAKAKAAADALELAKKRLAGVADREEQFRVGVAAQRFLPPAVVRGTEGKVRCKQRHVVTPFVLEDR